MSRRSISAWSEHSISSGMLALALGKYRSAEDTFSKVTDELLRHPGDRFNRYRWTAAFGKGFAEGMKERGETGEFRKVTEVAAAAKALYDAFLAFGHDIPGPDDYVGLGKSYARMGLYREALDTLDASRGSHILNSYGLLRDAKEMEREVHDI